MAVEFYDVRDQVLRNVLFVLNDDEFKILSNVLKDFHKQTGIHIDQYGKTNLSFDHIGIILGSIEKVQLANSETNKTFLAIKNKLKTIDFDVVAIGD